MCVLTYCLSLRIYPMKRCFATYSVYVCSHTVYLYVYTQLSVCCSCDCTAIWFANDLLLLLAEHCIIFFYTQLHKYVAPRPPIERASRIY